MLQKMVPRPAVIITKQKKNMNSFKNARTMRHKHANLLENS